MTFARERGNKMNNPKWSDRMRKTQYTGLGYRNDYPGLWRIYDISDTRPAAIGPQYPSKETLLADLYRFAKEGGF
jgi:hypothetical protein